MLILIKEQSLVSLQLSPAIHTAPVSTQQTGMFFGRSICKRRQELLHQLLCSLKRHFEIRFAPVIIILATICDIVLDARTLLSDNLLQDEMHRCWTTKVSENILVRGLWEGCGKRPNVSPFAHQRSSHEQKKEIFFDDLVIFSYSSYLSNMHLFGEKITAFSQHIHWYGKHRY